MTCYRFLFGVARRFVCRSWRSTAILSAMVITAVAALVFLASLAVGTNDAMIANSVRLFSGHIAVEHVPQGLADRLRVAGVEAVLLRRTDAVRIGEGPQAVRAGVVGVDPDAERRHTALWKKTVSGRYLEPGETALYLGHDAAERLKLAAGDTAGVARPGDLGPSAWRVAGIFRTGILYVDQLVFCPVEALRGTAPDSAAAVFLDDGADPAAVIEAYRALGIPEAHAWTELMPDLQQLIELNYLSMGIVIVLVFAIVSIGIACAFVIYVLKNLHEHGVMKALGLLPEEAVWLIVCQVGALTLAAAFLGAAAGALVVALFGRVGIDLTAFTSHNPYFVISGVIRPRLTAYSVVWPPVSAVAFGLLASAWPAVFVIRRKAAEILRVI